VNGANSNLRGHIPQQKRKGRALQGILDCLLENTFPRVCGDFSRAVGILRLDALRLGILSDSGDAATMSRLFGKLRKRSSLGMQSISESVGLDLQSFSNLPIIS
jgi:hypothetical protein